MLPVGRRRRRRVPCTELAPVGHETKPPARYTEASLVKELEERGIGRPSTYAAVIETIQARSYVWRKGTALVPAWTAFAVTNLLEQHFGHLVDYNFTATMEEALDVIARGEGEAEKWLTPSTSATAHPVCGSSSPTTRSASIDPRGVSTIPIGTDETGHEIIVRVGRYGPVRAARRRRDRVAAAGDRTRRAHASRSRSS